MMGHYSAICGLAFFAFSVTDWNDSCTKWGFRRACRQTWQNRQKGTNRYHLKEWSDLNYRQDFCRF
ncbi:hypothetical protein THTE_3935 [Thermogutta terrifontis]|uniref:Uncharacterized protein n=1 Tax=Thermogutta terrifontis TaxID=1331910 RepID=A0A286RKQ3_9BACT|nr:hypothetical protein THTE_3935 [Thermogutta terrifontis]